MFGNKHIHVDRCENSLTWAKSVIADHPHATLLTATKHEMTRGRHNRVWEQFEGQLLLTYIIKPPSIAHDPSLTYLYYALTNGVHEGLKHFAKDCQIKWPNDCVISGKKVAGLLLEPVWSGQQLEGIVLGVGVNVNVTFTQSHPLYAIATSLHSHADGIIKEQAVHGVIQEKLSAYFAQWSSEHLLQVWDQYKKSHIPIGSHLTAHRNDGKKVIGSLVELAADGSITLDTGDCITTLHVKDVGLVTQRQNPAAQ